MIAERLAPGFGAPFFTRGTMNIPALSLGHFRMFMEKSVGPLQKLVEAVVADEPKLSAIRAELDALVLPYSRTIWCGKITFLLGLKLVSGRVALAHGQRCNVVLVEAE